MGLRLLVHYYDRSEAFVVRSVLESAGILVLIQNEHWLRFYPQDIGPLGGYRLWVSEFDLEDAEAVLVEALENPILEGERLELRGNLVDYIMSPILGYVIGGLPVALREAVWIPFEQPPAGTPERSAPLSPHERTAQT